MMDIIYHVKADELDQDFLDALKAMFKDKEIEIAVYERDETAYLLRSPANRERLLRAIADIESSQNIVAPAQEQFQ
jgi:antitoxin YefM